MENELFVKIWWVFIKNELFVKIWWVLDDKAVFSCLKWDLLEMSNMWWVFKIIHEMSPKMLLKMG
jgi:hypothetical protein